MDYTNLTHEFEKAGLRLKILYDPIRTQEGMEFIVQVNDYHPKVTACDEGSNVSAD